MKFKLSFVGLDLKEKGKKGLDEIAMDISR